MIVFDHDYMSKSQDVADLIDLGTPSVSKPVETQKPKCPIEELFGQ
jgi:hypothetical protein